MGANSVQVRRLVAAALLIAVLALLVGCGDVDPMFDQNTFSPEGDVARKQRDILIVWVLVPAAVIFVVVQAVLIYAVIRFRRKKGQELPRQVHGNNRLELAWTIAPAILLLIIAVPTVAGVIDLGRDAADDALQVRVTAQQFSWVFQYPDLVDAEGKPLLALNELHIPVDREIGVTLESVDVIHSFWVPKLAGKLDAVPGRTNSMWFNATKVGSYSGQCAEFCGVSPEGTEGHWSMRLTVVAESEEDFEAWVADQLEGGGAARSRTGEPALVSYGE